MAHVSSVVTPGRAIWNRVNIRRDLDALTDGNGYLALLIGFPQIGPLRAFRDSVPEENTVRPDSKSDSGSMGATIPLGRMLNRLREAFSTLGTLIDFG